MKKLMITMTILIMSIPAFGQSETLISGQIESGGYGGPEVKFASINGDWEVLVGGRGGWIINHKFVLGGAGYGMATEGQNRVDPFIPFSQQHFELGYGGVMLGYISRSDKLIHVTFDLLIGGGGLSHGSNDTFTRYPEDDAFFIAEPNVNFILNVTQRVRFGFGAGYRITAGADFYDIEDEDLRGVSINLLLKFGKF